ncbi:MAG: hypothetical protein ACYC3X_12885 [Pirellulaceae bacterium]
MLNIVVALVGILGGVLLIRFRKKFAAYCIEDQNRLWGFRFGERTTRMTASMIVVIALGWIAIGLMALLSLL